MQRSDLAGRVRSRLDTLSVEAARAFGEDPARAGVLVALSGGPDSVALVVLAALTALGAVMNGSWSEARKGEKNAPPR